MRGSVPVITQEFEQPLFAVAFSPASNEYLTGFVDGTVSAYSYDVKSRTVTEKWSTKRHKESCRTVGYDQTGEFVYTAGSDKVIKKANAKTGKVVAKNKAIEGIPTVMVVGEEFLCLGTEDGSVLYYRLDDLNYMYGMKNIQNEHVSSILSIPGKSKYQVACSTGSVVNTVDVRKEKVVLTSDDQEDEITSGCLTSSDHCVFGMTEGVLTIWKNEHLQDQVNRVRVSTDSVDCLIAGEEDNIVYAGCSDGNVYEIDVRSGKKLTTYNHDPLEEVTLIELDYEYRVVSAGMDSLKIWSIEGDAEESKEPKEPKGSKKAKPQKPVSKQTKKRKLDPMGNNGVASFADL